MISRRKFTQGVVAAGVVGGALSTTTASAAPGASLRAGAGVHTSLGPIKRVKAGVLETAYAEFGPRHGQPVLLLHGWPYDAHSYVDVAPILAAAGLPGDRARSCAATERRASGPPKTVRNGQQSAVALDIDRADGRAEDRQGGARRLRLGRADRRRHRGAVAGALQGDRRGQRLPDHQSEGEPRSRCRRRPSYGWWYQYYFATERGATGYRQNRHDFNKLIWRIASPPWNFDDATYGRSAAAFDNPDHVDIVIHNYRWRLSLAPGEAQYDALRAKAGSRRRRSPYRRSPSAATSTARPRTARATARKFTGKYEHRVLDGIGHNVPQEAPQAFAQAVIDADNL